MAAAAGSEVVGTARFEYRSDHGTLHMRELMASLRDDRGGSPPFKAFTDFPVFNARLAGAELDSHGFCLLPHASREAWRADRYAVADRYAEEVCELLQQATGADHVFRANPQPVIRVESAVAGQAGPALFVHSDFTHDHKDALVAAVEALQSNPEPPNVRNVVAQQIEATGLTAADVRESRVVMLNTWRPVMEEPLQRYPLAVADCRTVKDGEVLGARASACLPACLPVCLCACCCRFRLCGPPLSSAVSHHALLLRVTVLARCEPESLSTSDIPRRCGVVFSSSNRRERLHPQHGAQVVHLPGANKRRAAAVRRFRLCSSTRLHTDGAQQFRSRRGRFGGGGAQSLS